MGVPLAPAAAPKARAYRTTLTATWAAAGFLFLVLGAVMVNKLSHHDFKDAEVWYDVGRRVLEGRSLLRLEHYRYPPTFALLIAPLCLLPYSVYFLLWYAINAGLFVISVRLTLALVAPDGAASHPRLLWLPALMTVIYAADNFFLGQTNILVMVLFYWSLLETARRREWRAGIPLALTIVMKVFTLPWLAYLLYRRQFRAALSTLACCLVLMLILPAPIRGFHRNLHEVKDWGLRVVEPYLAHGKAGDWGQHALDYGNQSLQAVLHRLLTRTDASVVARHGPTLYVNVASLEPSAVNPILLAAFALLAASFVVAAGWPRPRDRMEQVTELAMASVLVLLVSAIAWTYFYVALLLPIAVALVLLRRSPALSRAARRLLIAALWVEGTVSVLLAWSYPRAIGSLCWTALLLYFALARACWELRRHAA